MNMVPTDEFIEHTHCLAWLGSVADRMAIVEEYRDCGCDISIQQYIKIMHPEVYVAWRLSQ